MKLLYNLVIISLTIFFFNSCNFFSKDINEKDKSSTEFDFTDDKTIFGFWRMCSFTCDGVSTNFNVCQIITFNINGTGTVGPNAINSENFIWKLKKGNLSITHLNVNLNNTFSDTTFQIRLGEKNETQFLTIIHKSNDCEYYLSK